MMRRKMALGLALAGAALLGFAPVVASAADSPIAASIADSTRPAADVEKDASRNPAALIAFAGVKPGQQVIDVWTGSGYWARLFGKIVGPKGHVIAYVPAEVADSPRKPVEVAKAMAAEPGRGNVEVLVDPLADAPPKDQLNRYDVIWIFENYHDLYNSYMKGADVAAFNRAVLALLKPGGVYVIVDHATAPGAGLTQTETLHRIDPAAVRAALEKVGFVYDGSSDVLANPADPHTAGPFDPAIRGKTDRFALRFRKPG